MDYFTHFLPEYLKELYHTQYHCMLCKVDFFEQPNYPIECQNCYGYICQRCLTMDTNKRYK